MEIEFAQQDGYQDILIDGTIVGELTRERGLWAVECVVPGNEWRMRLEPTEQSLDDVRAFVEAHADDFERTGDEED